jgi:hypothetical protein
MEDIVLKKIENLYLLLNGAKNDMFAYGYGKYPYLRKSGKKKSKK